MRKFVEKMVKDRTDLEEKITKTKSLIESSTYNDLPQKEKKLLVEQVQAMESYSRILKERIEIYL